MKAELLSADFAHEDCDETQMALVFRTKKGGVIGGEWEVFCPAMEPNMPETVRAIVEAITGTSDEETQKRLFSSVGSKPSTYFRCIRRAMEVFIRNAANRTWPSDRDITFSAELLGIEPPTIGEK